MMQLCVCKEGGRRNRGGNRSRSLGHQPAVEPATLPPTAPFSLTLFLHPSTPFVPPITGVLPLCEPHVASLQPARLCTRSRARALPSSSSNNVNSYPAYPAYALIMPSPPSLRLPPLPREHEPRAISRALSSPCLRSYLFRAVPRAEFSARFYAFDDDLDTRALHITATSATRGIVGVV